MAEGELCVAIDVTAVPARPVGAGRYVLELVRALGKGIEPVLFARRDDAQRWERLSSAPSKVRAAAPRGRPGRVFYEELVIGTAAVRAGARVFHGPHYSLPRRCRLPLVVTVHDLTMLEHPEWHERAKVAYFKAALRHAARDAAVVICPSDATARAFVRHLSPVGEVVTIAHGLDHGRFGPEPSTPGSDESVLQRLGVEPPYVLHLGTIEPRKNLPGLLAAFDRLAASDPKLRLVIAGPDGWGCAGYEAARDKMANRSRVDRLGYIDHDDVAPLLRRAGAVAYPAFEEGFGLPVLEALACGAPVVTTRGTAMAEVAADAALLVAPGDTEGLVAALERTLYDPESTASRRSIGLERAAGYTWRRCAAEHVAAYRRALGA